MIWNSRASRKSEQKKASEKNEYSKRTTVCIKVENGLSASLSWISTWVGYDLLWFLFFLLGQMTNSEMKCAIHASKYKWRGTSFVIVTEHWFSFFYANANADAPSRSTLYQIWKMGLMCSVGGAFVLRDVGWDWRENFWDGGLPKGY